MGVYTFPEGVCPKMNVIAQMEFELAYYDSAVHRFEYFTTRTPSEPTLARSGSTWYSPFYVSKRNVWHLNRVQTNDLCWIELLEIELFDIYKCVNQWLIFNWIISDT